VAYIEDWYCYAAITVDKTKVVAAAVEIAVYLNEDNLPDMMLDADGTFAAKADGADIRFSSDSGGASPLPFHIVEFTQDNNPANATANIWVLVEVGDAADTVFYVWWRNAAATALPVDDDYGQYETWKGSAPCRSRWMCDDGEDASENGADFSETNVSFVAGKIDDCAEFDEDEVAVFDFPASQTEMWWEGWVYVDSAADDGDSLIAFLPFYSWITFAGAGYKIVLTAYFDNTDGIWREDTELAFDTWHHVSISYDGALVANDPVWAINGAQPAQTETQTPVGTIIPAVVSPRAWLAGLGPAARLTGKLDEIALRLSAVSAATILAYETTRYNNQDDPAAFCSAGAGQIVRKSQLRV